MNNRAQCVVLLILLSASPLAAAEPVLFVAPISNNTGQGEYADVAAAMTDMIMVLLAESDKACVVERGRLDAVLTEQKLTLAGLTDKDTAVRVGKLLKADRIISGGIILDSDDKVKTKNLLITLHTWNTADGRLIGSVKATAEPDKLLELGLDITSKLAKLLEIELPQVDVERLDKNPLAELHYMRGLGYYHAGNYDRALIELFLTTGLNPMQDRAVIWRARCYIATEEYDHAIIELEDFLKMYPDSPLVPQAKAMLEKYRPMWAGYVPSLRDKAKAVAEKNLFIEQPVFQNDQDITPPTILLLPTADFSKRFDAKPFAELIEKRLGANVILLDASEAPKVGPLEGHKLIEQAEELFKKLKDKNPKADKLLILTEAALETDMDDRVISECWPSKGTPRVIVASCLWLHMYLPPDLRKVNPFAPPLPEKAEFYNFVLGCSATLCGAGECATFGCPVNQEWYLWDQRYYKSWLCEHCRKAILEHRKDELRSSELPAATSQGNE